MNLKAQQADKLVPATTTAPLEPPDSQAELTEAKANTAAARMSVPEPKPADVEPAPAPPVAVAEPASVLASVWLRWGLFGAGALSILGLVWFWLTRPRGRAHISLITHSLERD